MMLYCFKCLYYSRLGNKGKTAFFVVAIFYLPDCDVTLDLVLWFPRI